MTGLGLVDSHGRVIRDLRVSVTDRCNFRCIYCLPETEAAANFYRDRWATALSSPPIIRQWEPKTNLLAFEEIVRVVRIAASLGIHKVRVTGGEPLLRRNVEELIAAIAAVPGVKDIAMTTNGFLFRQKAEHLRKAGLHRVSFSCDSLNAENFKRITGRDGLHELLESIHLAKELGFSPIKINAVIIRGVNENEIEPLATFAREESLALRFIEFMPLDSRRAWQREMVVPGREILDRLRRTFDLKPVQSSNPSETARRWQICGSDAEVGIIASVTEPFCGHCNRIRLTADGKIRTCLFSVIEHDVRARLRGPASDDELCDYLRGIVWQKEERHHIGEPGFQPASRSMSCIGG